LNVIFNFRDASAMPTPPPEAVSAGPEPDDCRCLCGSLLARVVDGEVELKCRRCKRTLRVPIAAAVNGQLALTERPVRRAI
jgi:phage FluMu protein Com